jgi:hypothetical protein
VRLWLPWLTVAALDPLVQLKDTFGSFSIEEIDEQPLQALREKNKEYGRTRGFRNVTTGPKKDNRFVYLDDIQEEDSSVGYGNVGKKGSHGYGDAVIAVKGRKAAHALSLHPPRNGSSFISYRLDGNYRVFTVEAAISDSARGGSQSPLTFRIVGDGRMLWKSRAIKNKGQSERCEVKIGGIKELRLIVDCPGANAFAFAVWVDPRLAK